MSSRRTIQEIAGDHVIHPIEVGQWKRQRLDGASELSTAAKKSKEKIQELNPGSTALVADRQAADGAGVAQIRISAALTRVNCGRWSITITGFSVSAADVRC